MHDEVRWQPAGLLSPQQAVALAALVDTVVPADEFPSGTESGVLERIAAVLAGRLDIYRHCLGRLDEAAAAEHGQAFAMLTATQREDLLSRIASADAVDAVVGDVMKAYYSTEAAASMVGFAVDR